MNKSKNDVFKNKYVLIIFTIISLIIGAYFLVEYNSVEARCKRHVRGVNSKLKSGGNKMLEMQIERTTELLIKNCIDQGGP